MVKEGKEKDGRMMESKKDSKESNKESGKKNNNLKYFALAFLLVAVAGVFLFTKNSEIAGIGGRSDISGEVVKDQYSDQGQDVPNPKVDEIISSTGWTINDDTESYFLCKIKDDERQETCDLLNEIKCREFCRNYFNKARSEALSGECNFTCDKNRISGTAVCRCN